MEGYNDIFRKSKETAAKLVLLSKDKVTEVLNHLADLTDKSHDIILKANKEDLDKMDPSNPLYDRLLLTDKRLDSIASDIRAIAMMESPIGEIMEQRILPNGIELKKVRVPFGVVGVIYEARPNVTFDVFTLCFKTGNVSILKGGKDAQATNDCIIGLIHRTLTENNLPPEICTLLPATHEATKALIEAKGWVDVCIPRGGRSLIDFVRENAKVPVIETGAGVVHLYFDKDGDLNIGRAVIDNAKTRRVSVCNALDTLLIHKDRISQLPELISPLENKNVVIYGDSDVMSVLNSQYPAELLHWATPEDKDREWMDMKLGIYTVGSVEDAIRHIALHGSGHSESIVTENHETAELFCKSVDASSVYVNLPTSFTDGGQFGLGAEIGISTQKLGPRGPMGLKEITTYKYILEGRGQIRE